MTTKARSRTWELARQLNPSLFARLEAGLYDEDTTEFYVSTCLEQAARIITHGQGDIKP